MHPLVCAVRKLPAPARCRRTSKLTAAGWINEGSNNLDEGIRHLRICASIQDTAHARRARAHHDARLGRTVDRRAQRRAQLFRCTSSLPPGHPAVSLLIADKHFDAIQHRYCNLRENIKRSPRVRSCSAPSSPGPSRPHHQGARTSPATVYSGARRAHTASASSRSWSMCCLCQICFRLTREPVRRSKEQAHVGFAHGSICTGLFVTYPTSYEALVGRAKLQAGAPTPIIIPITLHLLKTSALPVSSQANGSSFWPPRAALGSLLSKLEKVCGGPVEGVYRYLCDVLTLIPSPCSARRTCDRLCIAFQACRRTHNGRRGLCHRLHESRLAE